MTASSDVLALYQSLSTRLRPEVVASYAMRALPDLDERERKALGQLSRFAERLSLMPEDWERPHPADHQLNFIAVAFGEEAKVDDPTNPEELTELLTALGQRIGWNRTLPGYASDMDWRNVKRPEGLSHRRRARQWRALNALARKINQLEKTTLRYDSALVARVGFASELPEHEVTWDIDALAFVAYFTARKNVRRGFTLNDRANAFDNVAQILYNRLLHKDLRHHNSPHTDPPVNWWLVAQTYSPPEVVEKLTDEEQGILLGKAFAAMVRSAEGLRHVFVTQNIDRRTMAVARGNDSDTWNLLAGAYNVSRARWVNLLIATHVEREVLRGLCPPKVPRLMAGDLMAWYRSQGQDPVHVDVKVANALPLAWEVLAGTSMCTERRVVQACRKFGLDPATSGWTGPLPTKEVAQAEPTPELVHGISVGDPILAAVLRRAGVWSGQGIRWVELDGYDFEPDAARE